MKLRIYNWEKGILDFADHVIESIEHGIEAAEELLHDSFKIFDERGQCLHTCHKHIKHHPYA